MTHVPEGAGVPEDEAASDHAARERHGSPVRTAVAAGAPDDPRTFESRVRALVIEHVGLLLQERLFVVAAAIVAGRGARGTDRDLTERPASGPAVLALDASGRQVVVEIARVLDEAALMRCLGVAGRSADGTRADLAKRYPAGPAQFHLDVAHFYDSVPLTDTQAGGAGSGLRLVIVCGEVDPAVRPALRFLREAGSAVEVLPLTWQTVDRVARQARRLKERAATEAVAVPSPPVPDALPSPDAAPAPDTVPSDGRADEARAVPGPVRAESGPAPVAPVAEPVAPAADPAATAVAPPASAAQVAAPSDVPAEDLMAQRRAEAKARRAQEVAGRAPLAPPVPAAPADPTRRLVNPGRRAEPLTITTELPLRPGARPLPRTAIPRPAHQDRPSQPLAQKSAALQAAVTGIPVADVSGEVVDPIYRDLRVLCAEISEAVPMVWVRERRGESHEAMLHPEGVIEVAGGARYRSPSKAATAVSGSMSQVDGWSAWRFGDNGPTLAEAWTEIYG